MLFLTYNVSDIFPETRRGAKDMRSIDSNVDHVAKWLRIIAVVITLITGFFSIFQGILSSRGLGLGGVLFHMSPGFFLLFVAAIAWQWGIIGGAMLIILGIIVFFLYLSMVESNLLVFIYALPSGLPPIVAGCLFIISNVRARKAAVRDAPFNRKSTTPNNIE
jgi:hypothetical protein